MNYSMDDMVSMAMVLSKRTGIQSRAVVEIDE